MENKDRLSPKAYEVIDGLQYPPFVGPEENISEFTAKAVVIGALIGAISVRQMLIWGSKSV